MTKVFGPKSKGVLESALVLALGLMASTVQALPTINLTNAVYNGVASSTQGTITNGYGSVLFARDNTQPAGTGVFNPFLRLDVAGNNKDEQGYNTSASNVLDNKSPVNWTHDVLISSLQLDSTGQYYQFTLDINEPGNAKSLLSLDGLRLYSTSTPSQSAQKVTPATGDLAESPVVGGFVGTKLWDLDSGVDRSVLLDATVAGGPGSGIADMVMLVSKAVIDSHKGAGENYLVLWSRFGLEQEANTGVTAADAGFEEWAYSKSAGGGGSSGGGSGGASGAITSPGSSALSVLGLALLGFTFRARRQAQSTA